MLLYYLLGLISPRDLRVVRWGDALYKRLSPGVERARRFPWLFRWMQARMLLWMLWLVWRCVCCNVALFAVGAAGAVTCDLDATAACSAAPPPACRSLGGSFSSSQQRGEASALTHRRRSTAGGRRSCCCCCCCRATTMSADFGGRRSLEAVTWTIQQHLPLQFQRSRPSSAMWIARFHPA